MGSPGRWGENRGVLRSLARRFHGAGACGDHDPCWRRWTQIFADAKRKRRFRNGFPIPLREARIFAAERMEWPRVVMDSIARSPQGARFILPGSARGPRGRVGVLPNSVDSAGKDWAADYRRFTQIKYITNVLNGIYKIICDTLRKSAAKTFLRKSCPRVATHARIVPMKFVITFFRKLFRRPDPKPTPRVLSRWTPL